MLKAGWPVLAIGALAAAVIETKLANFDVPEMFKINSALAGTDEKAVPKVDPKSPGQTLSNQFRLSYFKNSKEVILQPVEQSASQPSQLRNYEDVKFDAR